MPHEYDDIIDLPHHVSAHRTPMPMENRAAQFAPFAALTGHEAALNETARETQTLDELVADSLEVLNRKMLALKAHVANQPKVRVTHFVPDTRKAGGAYVQTSGQVCRVDEYERSMVLLTAEGKVKIAFAHIVDIVELEDTTVTE